MKHSVIILLSFLFLFLSCEDKPEPEAIPEKAPFLWENASIYFLLTDRFNNGDPSNDLTFNRTDSTAIMRGMMGGDIKGITQKIKEGYFNDLGINAIWFTPVVEQIHGIVDEGTGWTYAYHGYWAKDWTVLDPNFGTEQELEELVETAHQNDIRVLLDVVINHTGPVTDQDPVWPDSWVRTGPKCQYGDYETTVSCTLVDNLPDVKTDSNEEVELPPTLKAKWENEGRLEKEIAELDEFFAKTGHPRSPRFYIMKWLTDYIRKYGIDGYRVDTAKHTEETIWKELREEADIAFNDWKQNHPDKVLDDNEFYMVGEVYNYNVQTDQQFDFGDKKVNFFENGFSSLINFGFKYLANSTYDSLFSNYSQKLYGPLKNKSIVNYISSHDDSQPFDKERKKAIESATKLLLCPGAVQVYYGDETSRALTVEGAIGDANLRSFMNWDELENNATRNGQEIQAVLKHWQKLGQFRARHPSVGAGQHSMISAEPYYFKRTYKNGDYKDAVVVGIDLPSGKKEVDVQGIFSNGDTIREYYSGQNVEVQNETITLTSQHSIALFGRK